MQIPLPKIIQGGMGVAVSNWRLAQAVSRLGQLGVVSGTGLDQVLARRLQDGDPDNSCRRALEHFPFPHIAKRIMDAFFIPGGREAGTPYQQAAKPTINTRGWLDELYMVGNFVEVFLAREGHDNPVGINYLEKIQLPHLPSIYGALLAGAAFIVMGAGIPLEVPKILDRLTQHEPVEYHIHVSGATAGCSYLRHFNPLDYTENETLPILKRPGFYPIISSDSLATMMLRRAGSSIEGFIVENHTAGGHNAPPRGQMHLNEIGEPVYGVRDSIKLETIRKTGLPFWMAGGYGTPQKFEEALEMGAVGVQVGTPFALCIESGLMEHVRQELIAKALRGKAKIYTDPLASPTGFPFKVAGLEGTLSENEVYECRQRKCDIGYLREAYLQEGNSVGYRCAAEPIAAYLAKGGKIEDTRGRKCICNGLFANVGLGQLMANGKTEPCIVTLGDDFVNIGKFCSASRPDYTAADVIKIIMGSNA